MDMSEQAVDDRPTPLQTLAMVIGIFAMVSLYVAFTGAIELASFYVGFFFLLQWAGMDRADPKALLPALIGGLGGILHAWGIAALTATYGPNGATAGLLLVIVVLYALIRRTAPIIANPSYMMFFTVATIPPVMVNANFPQMLLTLVLATAFFGGLAMLVGYLVQRRAMAAQKA